MLHTRLPPLGILVAVLACQAVYREDDFGTPSGNNMGDGGEAPGDGDGDGDEGTGGAEGSGGLPGSGGSQGTGGDVAFVPAFPVPHSYWSLDASDISGTSLLATVGTIDGQIHGSSGVAGVLAEGLHFDGVNDYIDFGNVLNDVMAGANKQFSISMWVRAESTTKRMYLLAKSGSVNCPEGDTNSRMVSFGLWPGVPRLGFADADGSSLAGNQTANLPVTVGVWQQVAVTYDGTVTSSLGDRIRLYINGEAVPSTSEINQGTFPFDLEPSNAHAGFGINLSPSGEPCPASPDEFWYEGSMDEMAIWSVALSPSEMEGVYSATVGGYRLDAGVQSQ